MSVVRTRGVQDRRRHAHPSADSDSLKEEKPDLIMA